MERGLLVVISGPSGSGKGTVCAHLIESGEFAFSVSATTRAPRPGEVDGVNYHFLTRQRFEELLQQDEMLEYTEYSGNYYGTPRAAVEEALPSDTEQHLYRILLTGETGEAGVHIPALQESLSERFYALELRDRTRMAEDVWARAEEDSLRGLFLRELRAKLAAAQTEEDRETITRAARFGLAALDRRDLE